MASFPRHLLLPPELRGQSYQDSPLELDGGAKIWTPSQLAQVLGQLAPQSGERALLIGIQEGWAAALLAGLGLDVTAWDPSADRLRRVAQVLKEIKKEIKEPDYHLDRVVAAESEKAALERGPFGRILVLGAVTELPQRWLGALSPQGGRLVGPVGLPGEMALVEINRTGESYQRASLSRGRFDLLYPGRMINYASALRRRAAAEAP